MQTRRSRAYIYAKAKRAAYYEANVEVETLEGKLRRALSSRTRGILEQRLNDAKKRREALNA